MVSGPPTTATVSSSMTPTARSKPLQRWDTARTRSTSSLSRMRRSITSAMPVSARYSGGRPLGGAAVNEDGSARMLATTPATPATTCAVAAGIPLFAIRASRRSPAASVRIFAAAATTENPDGTDGRTNPQSVTNAAAASWSSQNVRGSHANAMNSAALSTLIRSAMFCL